MSVIDVLRDKGYEVTERPITITEIKEAFANGTLEADQEYRSIRRRSLVTELRLRASIRSIHSCHEQMPSPVEQQTLFELLLRMSTVLQW